MKRKIVICISNSIRWRKENIEYVILLNKNGSIENIEFERKFIYIVFTKLTFQIWLPKLPQLMLMIFGRRCKKLAVWFSFFQNFFVFKNPSRNLELGGFETSSIPFQKSIFSISNFKVVKKDFESTFTHLLPNWILYSLLKYFTSHIYVWGKKLLEGGKKLFITSNLTCQITI